MQSKTAKRWFVDGTVQGVGFRMFVQKTAETLGVAGWARNLDDGRVEVFGVGTETQLSSLAAALHIGPRFSHVRNVLESEEDPGTVRGFSIR